MAFSFVFPLASCEYELNLDDFEQPPMLFLECLAGSNDSTVVKVLAATPINKYKGEYDIEEVRLHMYVNGEVVPLEKKHTTSYYHSLYWYSDVKYKPGDRISVRAQLNGIRPVEAETVIPEAPSATIRLYGETENHDVRAEVSFAQSDCQYYGMRIYQTINYNDPKFEYLKTQTHIMRPNDEKITYIKEDVGGDECLVFWNAKDFENGKIDISMGPQSYSTAKFDSREYKVMLYSLTPDLYRYLLTLSATENGWSTGDDFLYRTLSAYSNIDGGLGVLGGITKTASGTITAGESVEIR